ncbi:ACT domain-containing protein ACR6 [Vitis vinifera]|uniref:ACT domain-containing protein ACR n=1 Tax=Vitis vinifera TaxID=29760 RepID=A0A438ECE2_VITVI|nr:ACT domain-containing protein ACR6 [Vitis vinifera]
MDDEYAKLIRRMNPPRVVIDNDASEEATVIQVDSVNKHGILLEVVQVLTDMNLVITKAYISSDGGWFMDVFNVVDGDGNKIRDKGVINYITKTLERDASFVPPMRGTVGVMPSEDHTSIELSGTDRPGLLSEVCAVLADLHCNVVNAEIWTHNARAAAVVHVTDDSTGCAIEDPNRLSKIKELLCNVLKGNNDLKTAKMTLSPPGFTHRERRLHQIMFADRDYQEWKEQNLGKIRAQGPIHAVCSFSWSGPHRADGSLSGILYQHVDGLPMSSDAERERVIECLEAAIERRASEGLELELRTEDRFGLLSDITRVFRENSLCIKRAEISQKVGKPKTPSMSQM